MLPKRFRCPLRRINRFDYLVEAQKPLLAAINGPAVGIGLVVALYCDMRFLAVGAKIGTAFARIGLPAEYGCAWLLPRIVGPTNGADLLLTGRTLLAEEATAMGLGRLLPLENFLGAVQTVAAEIAGASSPRSVRIIKQQMRQAWAQTLEEAMVAAERGDQAGARKRGLPGGRRTSGGEAYAQFHQTLKQAMELSTMGASA